MDTAGAATGQRQARAGPACEIRRPPPGAD